MDTTLKIGASLIIRIPHHRDTTEGAERRRVLKSGLHQSTRENICLHKYSITEAHNNMAAPSNFLYA